MRTPATTPLRRSLVPAGTLLALLFSIGAQAGVCESLLTWMKPKIQPAVSVSPEGRISMSLSPTPGPLGATLNFGIWAARWKLEIPALEKVVQRYLQIKKEQPNLEVFAAYTQAFGLTPQFEASLLDLVPQTGPLIIVMNHPMSGVEALLVASVLATKRPDLKVMANSVLASAPDLASVLIPVDFGSGLPPGARDPLRESVSHLQQGHAVLMFPSGTVDRSKNPSPWKEGISRILSRTEAAVLPIYVDAEPTSGLIDLPEGLGSLQTAIRNQLRPLSIFREIPRQQNQTVPLLARQLLTRDQILEIVGTPDNVVKSIRKNRPGISAELQRDLQSSESIRKFLESEEDLAQAPDVRASIEKILWKHASPKLATLLKVATYGMNHQEQHPTTKVPKPIAAPLDPQQLQMEIEIATTAGSRVFDSERFSAFAIQGLSPIVEEVCRLREQTFRSVGEGTGEPLDTDRFDANYVHIVLWDKEKKQVAGSYRLGPYLGIIPKHGWNGTYASTAVHFDASALPDLNQTMEMGRAFLTPEYQKNGLSYLWKGIANYLVLNPDYRYLTGFVSAGYTFKPVSIELMMNFLMKKRGTSPEVQASAHFLRPLPKKTIYSKEELDTLLVDVETLEQLQILINIIEGKDSPLPPLFHAYEALGARYMGVSDDPEFQTTDAFVRIDLFSIPERMLQRFFGDEAAEVILARRPN